MNENKTKVIKDYDKIDPELFEKVKQFYSGGFAEHLITFFNKDGKKITALPFETEDKQYLLRMTETEAVRIVEEDEDFDDDGFLKNEMKEEFEDAEMDYLSDAEEETIDEGEEDMEESDEDDDDY